ncbi:hypothetical protein [Scytonema sp. PCC 10023]|uniref:hypothetical protein n=1 Tax=Scytonema sp. PCC 10023 TaxID=1680591 RepID=UPI0039C7438C
MPKPKGVNPVSLENLQPGSEPRHGEPKRPRNVSVTDTGWRCLKQQAQSRGLSLAEFLELIGRGQLKVQDPA